jgi:hypothetical protein
VTALPQTVTITRPRHPLAGRELRVLGGMRRHGRPELLLVLPDGSKSLIPAAWTDLRQDSAADGSAGPQQAAAAATLGSLGDLLAACALAAALCARGGGEREQAARKPPAKEDSRAACSAQSAAGPGSGATCDNPAPRPAGRQRGHAAGEPDRPDGGSRHGSAEGER